MGNLLLFVVPLTLIVIAARFTRRGRYGSGKLPPGPPGRDHGSLLEGDRWNTFKSWNDRYGQASLFSSPGGRFVDIRLHRLCGNFFHRTATQRWYVSRWDLAMVTLA